MIDKDIINWLKDSFGGYMYERVGKEGRENSYEWYVQHEDNVKPIIDKIYPYLKVKKKQAEVLKKFFSTFKKENYNSGKITQDTREYRENLYWQIRNLNQNKGIKTHRQPERLNSELQQEK